MQVQPSVIFKGLATYIPGVLKHFCSSSGGTVSSRYCYAVWMRHLVKAHEAGCVFPFNKIAELGPGDSLGIGLCAVLCGVREYYALDAKPHANLERNKIILEELAMMLRRREAIPDEREFPNISPYLGETGFPRHILTDGILEKSLASDRLNVICRVLTGPVSTVKGVHIEYVAPWHDSVLGALGGGLDMVFSQAVMEHVESAESTYAELCKWLRPGGFMSHAIDYKSHGYTRDWNGHWAVSDFTWNVVKGNRPYLINRLPHSAHINAMKKAGFEILAEIKRTGTPLLRSDLSVNFKSLSDDDLMTSGAFVQAVKPLGSRCNLE